MTPAVGSVLEDRFRLEVLLEARGMNDLYRGVDLDGAGDGEPVAVLVLAPEFAQHAPSVRRVVANVRRGAQLRHPHLAPVLGAGAVDGVCYVAMPWIEGTNLARLLVGERRMPPVDVATLLVPVASALAALHSVGIIHRTISPTRIILGRAPVRVYVGGFGYGPLIAPEGDDDDRATTTIGGRGLVDYLAPEMALGARADERVDQYALAAVAYHAIAGRPPFAPATSLVCALAERQHLAPPSLAEVLREPVRPELEATLQRALAADPGARFTTIEAFADALWASAAESEAPEEVRASRIEQLLERSEAKAADPFDRPTGRKRVAVRQVRSIAGRPSSYPDIEVVRE